MTKAEPINKKIEEKESLQETLETYCPIYVFSRVLGLPFHA